MKWCLPKTVIRYIVGGLGIAFLALGMTAFIICYNFYNSELAKSFDLGIYALLVGLSLLLLFFLGALLGVIAAKTENRCWICIDQCYLFFLLIVFITILVAMLIVEGLFTQILDDFCSTGTDSSVGTKIDELFKDNVDIIFCSWARDSSTGAVLSTTIGCACNIRNFEAKFPTSEAPSSKPWLYNSPNIDMDGAKKLMECDDWENIFYDSDIPNEDLMKVMGIIEEDFSCSQICSPGPYYYFSDVNKGIPQNGCKDGLEDYVKTKIQAFKTISIFCIVASIIVIFFGLCLCCHPQKFTSF